MCQSISHVCMCHKVYQGVSKSQSQHLSDTVIKLEKKDKLKSLEVLDFNSKLTLKGICKKTHFITMLYCMFFLDTTNCKIIHLFMKKFKRHS